ncbi:MAG: hypothetical protein EZS28_025543 [Streblomastix strix]|uniref:SPRY domain-containing protein n=1 Tax=Streblomastix strix TaxID=222440 RepID=A0A5J4V8V5_9EUKA|nr:MAG: hypothetical protein EZS28_025543 [Streblomastix strix]
MNWNFDATQASTTELNQMDIGREKEILRKKIKKKKKKVEKNNPLLCESESEISEADKQTPQKKRTQTFDEIQDKSNRIVEHEHLLATLQQKIDKIQITSAQKLDEIPIQITVQPGSYTKEKNEFTYISTQSEYKTFPINPAVINGIFKCEMKINNLGDIYVGVMKSGLLIPFDRYPGELPYCIIFRQSGPVYQNSAELQGNQQMKDGDQIAIEVNLLTTPRTAHLFINGQQQPVFVSGLPKSVQFWFFLHHFGDSITVLSLKKLNVPNVTKIPDEIKMKWI